MTRPAPLCLLLVGPLLACGDDGTIPPDETGSESSTTDDSTTNPPDPTTGPGPTTGPDLTTGPNPTTGPDPTTETTGPDPTTETTAGPTTDTDSTSSTGDTDSTGSSSTGDTDSTGSTGDTDSTGSTSDTDSTGSTTGTTTDTSTTDAMMCGDATIEGDELCDGDNLGGESCVSLGYVGGTLTCNDQCAFDVSACLTCGDDILDPGEDCDGTAIEGTCADLGFTGGELGCTAECAFDTTACVNIPFPLAGEVFITEIMQNPLILTDAEGEWFEIFNPSVGNTYLLTGCEVTGPTDTGFTIDADIQIGPGEYVTIATDSPNGPGFVPDFQWVETDYNLSNSTDAVNLVCDGVTVDTVAYDNGATFPDPNGSSMSLDPPNYGAALNDMGTSWCEGSTSYNGDFGSPGAANPPCPVEMNYTIDFCRLQFPTIVATSAGTPVETFGRVFIAGLTDLSGLNDPAAQVIGYVGYGPDGSNPAVDAGWTWTAGVPNPGYSPASPNYEANNDEYHATFAAPPVGAYDFAFRFSGDGGATFTYCDGGDPGSSNGYAPADAGQLTVAPTPTPYFSEYLEGASNDKALELYNPNAAPFALAGCTIKVYANGNANATSTIMLMGSIPADDVYVVCDNDSNGTILGLCDQQSTAAFYSGDDAVEFACGTTKLDVIGQIGFQPNMEWLVNGVGTQNEDLRRKCSVTTGDPDGSNVFDPSLEWTTHLQTDLSDLGQYVCP